MIFGFTRARSGAFLLAAAVAVGPVAPLRAEEGGIVTVQAAPELQKRADLLLKGIGEGGGKVTFGGLEPGSTPEGLVIKDIEIISPDKKKVTIERIDIRSFDWDNPKEPRRVDLAFAKLVVASDAVDKDAQENFKDLGLTALTISGELAYKFDETEKAFEVTKVVLDFAEIGEVRLRFKLTGITPEDIKTATGGKPNGAAPGKPPGAAEGNQVMGVLSRLNVAGASVSFKDKSLVSRMIRSDAKKKSMSEHAARTQIIDGLAEEKSKAEDEVTREILDAAIKFVRNPGEIEVAANPPAPANVMMAFMTVMGNRATFKQLMGLSVSVK